MSTNNGNVTTWSVVGVIVGMVAIALAGTWAVFQAQSAAMEKRIDDLKHISESFVTQSTFAQYEKRVDGDIRSTEARLNLIEQTRPTTGQLEVIANNTDAKLKRIEDRLDKTSDIAISGTVNKVKQ